MGIPSYYKKLIGTIPGLVSKGSPAEAISWLFMDFNCLIYHCLHREDTPLYPGEADKDAWEGMFLDCVVQYCLKVIKQVKPTKGVYIAVDGVVPMAKMRQQRLRRFKSVWLTQHAAAEAEEDAKGPTWDRNAITPGTVFMSRLRTKLEGMIAKHGKKTWKLSSSDEPGEGEHKIIREWRTGNGAYGGNYAVYGLDADLIVLSMLGRDTAGLQNKVWLFREEVNAGKIAYDAHGEEEFEWFSISALTTWLCSGVDSRAFVLDYCFAMSVLGNDFLPSSLGLKIREDGHTELLELLRRLHTQGVFLIDPSSLAIRTDGLLELFYALADDEEARLTKYVSKKQYQARTFESSGNDVSIGHNDWPMYHMEEGVLLESNRTLVPDWRRVYLRHFFPGFSYSDVRAISKEYLYGIQWIWAYYTGRHEDVCYDWCYIFSLPPLWSWVCGYIQQEEELPSFPGEGRAMIRASDIQPVEQLTLVLPLESWSLVPPCPQRSLPYLAPHLFPASFSFETVGKRFFWECESMIPLPSIREVKHIVLSSPRP